MSRPEVIRRYGLSALLLLLASLAPTTGAYAHEIRPALLEISESEPGRFEVTWKVPMRDGRVLAITPVLPPAMKPAIPPSGRVVPGAHVERSTYQTDGESIVGETVAIDGLRGLQIDVLLRLELADGSRHSAILRPESPSFEIPARETRWNVAGSYWRMGTTHILGGIDHLLFVLALVLLVPGSWMLVKTITAFTLAHSVSLGLATLGFVHIPPGPTEAVIALSILFLAVEVVHSHQGRITLTERRPWTVSFAFGLFHGLGFAGALSQVGLPEHEIPLALLMFNVGVETGQILFLAAVLVVIAALGRMRITWPAQAWRALPYAIGSMAAFWTLQRVAAFL